ncbi:lipoate--protein ligase [Mycoplasma putrefaciens]|uniref:lipoate--protein ligase n=1 Tax=Mycoplasma putrefaciens (strain ATCC 15718 / NCTC 10155 / C30 KS-1 / KS-1) TaxID=743965 RepID=A0A7U3ZSW4_MYCPK|nr:lipoate--protein ligase [Mycoplasma putrefaciens]AEM68915.1 lipoyltransferase and lipoate-ligase family protein [Mycoplasma putrefaciens KS1]
MINLLISNYHDPAINLAIEEYLTYNYDSKDPIVFFWQNANTIVVGRNQNTFAEINLTEAWKDGVKIIKRNTGGGTVYQDLGNVCFSLIVDNTTDDVDYQKALQPIITYLNAKNIHAQFSGRNDMVIDGYKVSGNAQLKTNQKTLVHGTLLFDVDLTKIAKYLIVDPEKLKHQQIRSKPARVRNIKNFFDDLKIDIDLETFIQDVIDSYVQNEQINWIKLTDQQINAINKAKLEKYDRWEWNFGRNTQFSLNKKKYLESKGFIQISLDVSNGVIQDIKIYGDFLGTKGTEELEKSLISIKFKKEEIEKVLNKFDLEEIFAKNFTSDDFTGLLFE